MKRIKGACLFFACTIAVMNMLANNVKKHTYWVILAGGNGERLWPLSRRHTPKQLLTVTDNKTLLEQAIERIAPLTNAQYIWMSTTQQHVLKIKQLVEGQIGSFVIEPARRNTAPAILLSCLRVYQKDPDAVVVFLPADPYIPKKDYGVFRDFLEHAVDFAMHNDQLVLLGVQPTHPATGYGYIEFDTKTMLTQSAPFPVKRFREKPSLEVAEHYVQAGNMLWNIAIFCGKASVFIEEFKTHSPEIYSAVTKYVDGKGSYQKVPTDSIDYAVLEKSKRVTVLPVSFAWCDVGNIQVFLSLQENDNQDEQVTGVVRSSNQQTRIISVDSFDNMISVPNKLVALVGVDNLCIVETDDALLITKKEEAEKVRGIVKQLKQGDYEIYL